MMSRTSPRCIGVAVILAVALLGSLVAPGAALAAPATTKTQINYVVIPHADDEWNSWSLIEKSASNYPVFILLTRGEATGYCANPDRDAGKIVPTELRNSDGSYGKPSHSAACGNARTSSFLNFLGKMAQSDGNLQRPPLVGTYQGRADSTSVCRYDPGTGCLVRRSYTLYAGSKAAVMQFDVGDGDVTEAEARWAIRSAQDARALGRLPAIREYAVIAAAFDNKNRYPGCSTLTENDHYVLHRAVYNTDYGTVGPQWGATCKSDPDGVRTDVLDSDTVRNGMGVDSAGRPSGAGQVYYGWLFPGLLPNQTSGSVEQYHWQRF